MVVSAVIFIFSLVLFLMVGFTLAFLYNKWKRQRIIQNRLDTTTNVVKMIRLGFYETLYLQYPQQMVHYENIIYEE